MGGDADGGAGVVGGRGARHLRALEEGVEGKGLVGGRVERQRLGPRQHEALGEGDVGSEIEEEEVHGDVWRQQT